MNMINTTNIHLHKILNLAFMGTIFSFASYFCFISVRFLTADEISIFLRFFDSNALSAWVNYNFTGPWPTISTVLFWVITGLISYLGFIALVFSKVFFSLTAKSIEDQLDV